jgi:hypothetical protein
LDVTQRLANEFTSLPLVPELVLVAGTGTAASADFFDIERPNGKPRLFIEFMGRFMRTVRVRELGSIARRARSLMPHDFHDCSPGIMNSLGRALTNGGPDVVTLQQPVSHDPARVRT